MALSDYQVLTPERVSLQYDIAGVGSRGAAVLIDSLIQSVVLVVLLFGLIGTSAVARVINQDADVADALLLALFALIFFAVTAGYFILFEIIWSGQTPGKRIVGVRVLRENGYPIRPVDSTIRNVVRIVDGLPVGYAVGVLTMLCNKRSKRLGDFAAGTIVVREGGRGVLVTPDQVLVDQPQGPVLRSSDATLVRDFLLRRSAMNAQARRELASRLANAIAARYGLSVETDPELFLERLSP
jgi:uncharacterized RDD family membrane protein YckC